MPDISLCMTENCPLAEKCYRKHAKPDPYWQSYFEPPSEDCKHFLPVYEK